MVMAGTLFIILELDTITIMEIIKIKVSICFENNQHLYL